MKTNRIPPFTGIVLATLIPALAFQPIELRASLTTYDATIAADHGGGDGSLPYTSALTEPLEFDTTGGEEYDFGDISDDATFEFIVEGNPEAAQNGYLAVGENSGNSLRYEQWDDTGQLGFTRSGLLDYVFIPEGDEELVLSPTEPTHVTYVWSADDLRMDLYIDGELAGVTEDATFEMPTGVGFLGSNPGQTEAMEGTIHRVVTYDRALSPEAIQGHAAAWLASDTDPSIQVGAAVELALSGAMQTFDLLIANAGEENPLTISTVEFGGDNADKFSVSTALPFTIQPGGRSSLEYSFDPMGATGVIAASLVIGSDDPQRDEVSVQLSGVIHDPKLETELELDFGVTDVALTRPLEITNAGGTHDLVIASVTVSGKDADAFSAPNPGTITPGGSGQLAVSFTPSEPGGYDAVLTIASNDPVTPATEVVLSALVPIAGDTLTFYDAVIAADHGDGNGPYPYEAVLLEGLVFDGTDSAEFDFGEISDSATFEFILEGDPEEGGQDGYLAVGENAGDNLRYEQWDNTGQLGFTRLGVADYLFEPEDDPDLVLSPEVLTHVTYVWNLEDAVMQLYIDGVLVGVNQDAADFGLPTGAGFLGNNGASSEGMVGTIVRVVTYNDLLPEDVILRHAQAFTEGGTLAAFAITQLIPDLQANTVTITWTSASGISYRIERTAELAEGVEWEELEDGFAAAEDGDETTYTDESLAGGETTLYYRIVRE